MNKQTNKTNAAIALIIIFIFEIHLNCCTQIKNRSGDKTDHNVTCIDLNDRLFDFS